MKLLKNQRATDRKWVDVSGAELFYYFNVIIRIKMNNVLSHFHISLNSAGGGGGTQGGDPQLLKRRVCEVICPETEWGRELWF